MKTTIAIFIYIGMSIIALANNAITDPARDYLSSFTFFDGKNNIYSDDRLLRLDVDLNRDGQKETMLSLARNRDGKGGNVWAVYGKTEGGYAKVGEMTFNAAMFYLGNINSSGDYGLVSFWPGGAGEGVFLAHIFTGSEIKDIQIGEVRRDPPTGTLHGTELMDKYMGREAVDGNSVVTSIDAKHLAQEFGVTITPMPYLASLQQEQVETPIMPSSTPSNPLPESRASSTPSSLPSPSSSPSPTAIVPTNSPFPFVPVFALGALVLLVIAFLVRRKP